MPAASRGPAAPRRARAPGLPLALAAAALAAASLAACDLASLDGDDPAVPADHPCPDRALPPSAPSLWTAARLQGDPVPITLLPPLDPGRTASVTQGHDQLPTHQGGQRWAWDLEAPVGTPVRAAAPGLVVWVRDDSDRFGDGAAYVDDANWVVLDHGGGLFTAYVHLGRGSARVRPGDSVPAGAHLADTGLSGALTGPHLHFQLENAWSQSLPARFVTAEAPFACTRDPDRGGTVRRPGGVADDLVGRGDLSPVPADAFAGTGVPEIGGLPARLWDRSARYAVRGRAAEGASRVVVLVVPPEGGTAVAGVELPVAAGRFSGTVDPSVLPAGSYGWAAVATAPGEPAVAPATVRLSVVD